MTNKELKYLKRIDLLDLMIAQDKEIEQLKKRLEETEKRANLAEAVIHRFLKDELPTEESAEQEGFRTADTEAAEKPEASV